MTEKDKKHYNLYYIFEEDKRENLMELSKWLKIRSNILKYPIKDPKMLDKPAKSD